MVITPYDKPGIVVDKDTVKHLKELSSKNRTLSSIPVSGSDMIRGGEGIGLAYVKSGQITGEVHFAFFGTDEKGSKLEVDFSEVEKFKVLRKDGVILVLEIDQFPVITPEELLIKKPSYTELRANYRKSVRLRLSIRAMNGAKLYLVAKRKGNEQLPIVPIEDVEPEREIRFSRSEKNLRQALWWAIPSVVSDPAYPYRLFFKR
jgi:hypothetical protein